MSLAFLIMSASFLAADANDAAIVELRNPALFAIRVDGKVGYINAEGRIVIVPQFMDAGGFNEGLAWATSDRKAYGYIDATGRFAIPQTLPPGVRDFHCGRAFCLRGAKCGFIDQHGAFAIQPDFDNAEDFEDAVAVRSMLSMLGRVQFTITRETVGADFHDRYIDRDGVPIGEAEFNADGVIDAAILLPVKGKGGYGFIDCTGRFTIPPQFGRAERFSEGLACVEVAGQAEYGFIDRLGKFAFPKRFKSARQFKENMAAIWLETSPGIQLAGYIDHRGSVVVPPQFSNARDFTEGLAAVLMPKPNEKWGFIDHTGCMTIEPVFDFVDDFRDGLARITLRDGKAGYIDKNGKVVWKPSF